MDQHVEECTADIRVQDTRAYYVLPYDLTERIAPVGLQVRHTSANRKQVTVTVQGVPGQILASCCKATLDQAF